MRRKLIIFRRLAKSGVQNFFRNSWLSVAATAVMVVALTIILGAVLINFTARNAIKELSKDIKVSIYFQDDVVQAQRDKLQQALKENKAVVEVEFISREIAQARLKQNQDNDFVDQTLALLGSDALPESFDVSVNDLSKLEEVGDIAKKAEFKDIVGQSPDDITLGKTRSKDTIDRAASAQRYITLGSIIAAGIFASVSVLIIFNTIRMAIFTRAEEIRIMKLIGATPDYIRGPFIIEACMYGIIAGLLANAVVYTFVLTIGSKLSSQREFAETYTLFTSPSLVSAMVLGGVLAGILVAILSSTLAMEKYLRLKRW